MTYENKKIKLKYGFIPIQSIKLINNNNIYKCYLKLISDFTYIEMSNNHVFNMNVLNQMPITTSNEKILIFDKFLTSGKSSLSINELLENLRKKRDEQIFGKDKGDHLFDNNGYTSSEFFNLLFEASNINNPLLLEFLTANESVEIGSTSPRFFIHQNEDLSNSRRSSPSRSRRNSISKSLHYVPELSYFSFPTSGKFSESVDNSRPDSPSGSLSSQSSYESLHSLYFGESSEKTIQIASNKSNPVKIPNSPIRRRFKPALI